MEERHQALQMPSLALESTILAMLTDTNNAPIDLTNTQYENGLPTVVVKRIRQLNEQDRTI